MPCTIFSKAVPTARQQSEVSMGFAFMTLPGEWIDILDGDREGGKQVVLPRWIATVITDASKADVIAGGWFRSWRKVVQVQPIGGAPLGFQRYFVEDVNMSTVPGNNRGQTPDTEIARIGASLGAINITRQNPRQGRADFPDSVTEQEIVAAITDQIDAVIRWRQFRWKQSYVNNVAAMPDGRDTMTLNQIQGQVDDHRDLDL